MSQQIINIGAAPNDGSGDPARNAFSKVNANFTEVYTDVSDLDTRIDGLQYSNLGGLPALGTAATRDVGTDTGNVVEVLSGNKLPALDGSNLINVSGGEGGGSITIDGIPTNGQTAFWTASNHLEGRTLVAADISDLETATGIPAGGSTGQILAKNSGTDFDTEWIASPTTLPTGGVSGQVLTKDSGTDGDASWHTLSTGSGDVVGPASSVNGRAALFSGTSGKLLVQSSAAPVLEGDSRLTNSRSIADGSYTDFAVSSGVATVDRTSRTLTKMFGTDVSNVIGTMNVEDVGEVADTLNYTNPDGTPGNMTSAQLAAWSGADVDLYLASLSKLKEPVRALDLQTSATLSTAYANGQTVGGITVATGDRILLAGRTTGSQNGVYIVQASGSPVRATDADSSPEIMGGAYLILEGTSTGRLYRNTNTSTITVDTTSLTYSEIPGTATAAETITGTDTNKRVTPSALTGLIGKGTDVAAAATTTLGSGDFFHITGTGGPITAFAFTNDRQGRRAILFFESTVTITNGVSLITQDSETFTTTAGDTFLLISEGTGTFRLFRLKRAKAILALGNKSSTFTIPILQHHTAITVTLTGNATISGVSGSIDGGPCGSIPLFVTQDDTGSRTLSESASELTSWGSDALTLVTTAAATTVLLIQGKPDGSYAIMNTGRSY